VITVRLFSIWPDDAASCAVHVLLDQQAEGGLQAGLDVLALPSECLGTDHRPVRFRPVLYRVIVKASELTIREESHESSAGSSKAEKTDVVRQTHYSQEDTLGEATQWAMHGIVMHRSNEGVHTLLDGCMIPLPRGLRPDKGVGHLEPGRMYGEEHDSSLDPGGPFYVPSGAIKFSFKCRVRCGRRFDPAKP